MVKDEGEIEDKTNSNSDFAVYFITRMDKSIPSNFYYIDSLENSICILSSHPYLENDKYVKILTYCVDNGNYGTYFEDIFNIDPNYYL